MISTVIAIRQRLLAILGRVSMYRLILMSLVALAALALVLSAVGVVTVAPAWGIAVTLAVLVVVIGAVDMIAQRLLGRGPRWESSVVTALILLFVLYPVTSADEIGGVALAGAIAAASKYLLVWRGRHIFNPAAVGAAVVTLIGGIFGISSLTFSAWWIGTPALAVAVLVLGILVCVRTEKTALVLVFLVVVTVTTLVRTVVLGTTQDPEWGALLSTILFSSPFLFLGFFMLTEPLTLPRRRGQQLVVAVVVGLFAGWPLNVGVISLGQERALLIGNLLAFVLAAASRGAVRLTLRARRSETPGIRTLEFEARRPLSFRPGQYLELEVPHRRADARGSRREFSIVSAPEDAPFVRIAYREGDRERLSSFKRALAEANEGAAFAATGVWGDLLLPPVSEPVLLVAAGVGVTPFVSQLRHARLSGEERDIVLVYVAGSAREVAFREEIEASGVRVVVCTPDDPGSLPGSWQWTGGGRMTAEVLTAAVPDLARRRALISGPPRLIAELAPALRTARSVRTDAFAGY